MTLSAGTHRHIFLVISKFFTLLSKRTVLLRLATSIDLSFVSNISCCRKTSMTTYFNVANRNLGEVNLEAQCYSQQLPLRVRYSSLPTQLDKISSENIALILSVWQCLALLGLPWSVAVLQSTVLSVGSTLFRHLFPSSWIAVEFKIWWKCVVSIESFSQNTHIQEHAIHKAHMGIILC